MCVETYPIPDLGGNAVSGVVLLVMVSKMIGLHSLKVELHHSSVVEIVMHHIVADVAKEDAGHQGICNGAG